MDINSKEQERFSAILTSTITSLCKNGMINSTVARVEGLLGVTLVNNVVFLINIQEQLCKTDVRKSAIDECHCKDNLHLENNSTMIMEGDAGEKSVEHFSAAAATRHQNFSLNLTECNVTGQQSWSDAEATAAVLSDAVSKPDHKFVKPGCSSSNRIGTPLNHSKKSKEKQNLTSIESRRLAGPTICPEQIDDTNEDSQLTEPSSVVYECYQLQGDRCCQPSSPQMLNVKDECISESYYESQLTEQSTICEQFRLPAVKYYQKSPSIVTIKQECILEDAAEDATTHCYYSSHDFNALQLNEFIQNDDRSESGTGSAGSDSFKTRSSSLQEKLKFKKKCSNKQTGVYKQYRKDSLRKAIKDVLNGNLNISQASRKFGVPNSTLRTYAKRQFNGKL